MEPMLEAPAGSGSMHAYRIPQNVKARKVKASTKIKKSYYFGRPHNQGRRTGSSAAGNRRSCQAQQLSRWTTASTRRRITNTRDSMQVAPEEHTDV
jgi:hypothetical protein